MNFKSFIYLIFIFIAAGCSFEEPEFDSFDHFKLLKADGKQLSVSFDMQVKNPNWFGMKVKKGTIQISADDQAIGVAHLSDKLKIQKKSDTTYVVPISIDLADGAMFRLFKMATSKSVKLQFSGSIRGSILGIGKTIAINETKTVDGGVFKSLTKN
jgi:LEA14-like dessication related protein